MLEIVDRAAPDDPFRRLATAMVASAVGLPATIYGAFALTWPIQRWLYVGQVGSVGVFLFGLFALATAHSLVRDVSRAVEAAETPGPDATGADRETAVDTDDDPLTTLKNRYAAGEVSDEEFERRVDRLIELDEVEAHPNTQADDRLLETE